MVLDNQIPGFLNQPFLQNKLIKQCNTLLVGTNSQKSKIKRESYGWAWSKRVWPIWSLDSKIDFISRMNRWN